jgi:hypothetical protein
MNPVWIWVQAAIVFFVVAGIIIGIVQLLSV